MKKRECFKETNLVENGSFAVPQNQPPISKCQLCQEGMQVIDYLLNSALVKGNLQKLLGVECANLPSPYNAEVFTKESLRHP